MFSRVLIANRGEIAVRIARAAADLGIDVGRRARHGRARRAARREGRRRRAARGLGGRRLPRRRRRAACRRARAARTRCTPATASCQREPAVRAGLRRAAASPSSARPRRCWPTSATRPAPASSPRRPGCPCSPPPTGTAPPALLEQHRRGDGQGRRGRRGRGMRRVTDPAALADALARCASEAGAAFGDDRVYAEELLRPARHVEVQILGDGTGAVTQLGERDCSVQRRHQKVVEVAPAPGLDPGVRAELLAAAVRLGESVRYRGPRDRRVPRQRGPGRVHRGQSPAAGRAHDHRGGHRASTSSRRRSGSRPGRPSPSWGSPRTRPRHRAGSALQARITLEHTDDDGSTTPTGGTLTAYELPSGRGIRVDGAGYVGYRTSLRYDPLLAKLIVSDRSSDVGVLAGQGPARAERGEHRRRRDEPRRARRHRRLPGVRRGRAAPPTSSTTTAPRSSPPPARTGSSRSTRRSRPSRHPRRGPGRGEDAVHAVAPGTVVSVEVADGRRGPRRAGPASSSRR